MNIQTSIEKIKNYYDISKYLDESQQIDLMKKLNLTKDDIKRSEGLQNETEFLLMIYLLGWVKDFFQIDESFSQLTKTKTADFCVETIKGKKLSIEIKSSEKSEKKFSKNLVLEKKEFAEKLGYKSYFAIKLSGHWMLFSNDYIVKQNYKITLEKDFINSRLEREFGERLFIFPKGLEILSIYSKTKKSFELEYPDYGNMVSFKIKHNGKEIYKVNGTNSDYFFLTLMCENLHDVMSNQHQEIIKLDSDRTLIIEKFSQDYSILKLSAFLMSPINHMRDENGNLYTFDKFKEVLKNKNEVYIDRLHILNTLDLLDEQGYPIIMFLNKKGYRLKELKISENKLPK